MIDVPVSKYHGCGNDFILLSEQTADSIENLEDFIVQVCDRHTGIGADGLIVAREHPFFMEYYNQDGSRAPMCGNGIRCLSRYLHDQKLFSGDRLEIETLAGLKTVEILSLDPFLVRVNMGRADFSPESIDAAVDQPIWKMPLALHHGERSIYSFFMSTTHTVVFDENPMGDIEAAGKEICFHPLFEKQTNVNFVRVLDPKHIQVQTYERGCGVTLACGTGVCASALVCVLEGLCEPSVDVELKKGHLNIDVLDDQTVLMTGPAEKILTGLYSYTPSQNAISNGNR